MIVELGNIIVGQGTEIFSSDNIKIFSLESVMIIIPVLYQSDHGYHL